MTERIILGTRASELALTQTGMVEAALRARWPEVEIKQRIIKTSGDEGAARSMAWRESSAMHDAQAGRKGLFTAEIERALLAGDIDVAVHSAKDLPSGLTVGTEIAAVLPRGSVDDVLVSTNGSDLDSLPQKSRVATGSVRRRHQLRWKRSDLEIVDLRGNVPTRLRKLIAERWDGVLLARAGLERLRLGKHGPAIKFEGAQFTMWPLPRDIFVPAGGQGIIAMQIRSNDERVRCWLEAVSDPNTRLCLHAEREFLRLLHGDCNQPVGVSAIVHGDHITINAQLFLAGATSPQEARVNGLAHHAEALAAELFRQINGN